MKGVPALKKVGNLCLR